MLKKPDHCNVEECLKVAESLGVEAHFDMDYWAATAPDHVDEDPNYCGTVACIAGHALLINDYTVADIQKMDGHDTAMTAAEIMGIDPDTADALFEPVLNKVYKVATPALAKEAIMNVIRTGEPKWEEVIS